LTLRDGLAFNRVRPVRAVLHLEPRHGARCWANLGASLERFPVITRPAAVGLALLLCAAGCRDKSDEFTKATRCLREHDAQDVTLTSFSRAAAGRGWRLQRFDVGGDRIILLGARSDRGAQDAQKRVEEAGEALGGPLVGANARSGTTRAVRRLPLVARRPVRGIHTPAYVVFLVATSGSRLPPKPMRVVRRPVDRYRRSRSGAFALERARLAAAPTLMQLLTPISPGSCAVP
jgi:hypothetical protein